MVVLLVCLKMLRQIRNAPRQQGHLHFGGACVFVVCPVAGNNLHLLLCTHNHGFCSTSPLGLRILCENADFPRGRGQGKLLSVFLHTTYSVCQSSPTTKNAFWVYTCGREKSTLLRFIGFYNFFHQTVADDVFFRKLQKTNSLNPLENVSGMHKP